MKRTQIQMPDALYRDIKRLAQVQEWSITEVLRRGAEYMVRCYRVGTQRSEEWEAPAPRRLGELKAPVESWRELSQEL